MGGSLRTVMSRKGWHPVDTPVLAIGHAALKETTIIEKGIDVVTTGKVVAVENEAMVLGSIIIAMEHAHMTSAGGAVDTRGNTGIAFLGLAQHVENNSVR